MKARLKKVCIIGAVLLLSGCALVFIHLRFGVGIPCMFHLITGLQCPGCGTTRMIMSLLKLDFRSAWHYNPVMLVMLPFLAYIIISDTVHWIESGQNKNSKAENGLEIAMIAVLVIFGIVRNII